MQGKAWKSPKSNQNTSKSTKQEEIKLTMQTNMKFNENAMSIHTKDRQRKQASCKTTDNKKHDRNKKLHNVNHYDPRKRMAMEITDVKFNRNR